MTPARVAASFVLAAAAAAVAIPAAVAANPAPLQGKVLEARDVDSYTYLRLATAGGETWAAVPSARVQPGAQVTITNPMVMRNFESKTLKKTFDQIVFGQLGTGAVGPAATGAAAASPPGTMPAATASAPPRPIKLAKAGGPDARTVAEVVKGKAALKDKPVTVHAQVVKVNLGIMGKNWLHLQDGSGSAADGSHDVVVTSKDIAAVGDIVTVKGTVRTDVDVGAGYTFAVMIDNGAIGR